MADLAFLAGSDFNINTLSGSGLAFFSDAGFGGSVLVGAYQGRTFISDGNGVTQGAEVDNIKFANVGSGIIGQTGSGVHVKAIPNYLATLNARFTHSSAVKVQNVQARIYDRSNINNPASGVTVKGFEHIHPGITQVLAGGSGDDTWLPTSANPQTGTITLGGSGAVLTLANSPGTSGLFAGNGSDSQKTDTQHDWYVSLTASPDSIGSKLFGFYMSLEYL